jgi:FG-GAP repeat
MKKKYFKNLLLIGSLLSTSILSFSQQATEIDSKSVKLPRYNNIGAITAAIPAPQQGMMVYNQGTATNWYYNGSTWVNLAMAASTPIEPEGFGSWGCANAALTSYQPLGNANGRTNEYFGGAVSISGDYAIVGAWFGYEAGLTACGSATIFKRNASTGVWESEGKILNPAAANNDYFGRSVSISGNFAIVGASGDDEAGFSDNGSATIFKRNTSTGVWESQGKLLNQAPANYDNFGESVSISGDYAIVGASGDDESGFGDNGSATIFKRNTSTGVWESQGKFLNQSPGNLDYFGNAVSISGDFAIVGSIYDNESGISDVGSATIFKRNTSTGVWESQGKLLNQSPQNSDFFGSSVSISGDYAIVGAYYDSENSLIGNGSATIFKRNTSTGVWESQVKLLNSLSAGNDSFGKSVSISGEYAMVSADYDDEQGLLNNGSFSIYKRYGESWTLVSKSSNPGAISDAEKLGNSVAIDGTTRRFMVGSHEFSNGRGLVLTGKVR